MIFVFSQNLPLVISAVDKLEKENISRRNTSKVINVFKTNELIDLIELVGLMHLQGSVVDNAEFPLSEVTKSLDLIFLFDNRFVFVLAIVIRLEVFPLKVIFEDLCCLLSRTYPLLEDPNAHLRPRVLGLNVFRHLSLAALSLVAVEALLEVGIHVSLGGLVEEGGYGPAVVFLANFQAIQILLL